MVGMFKELVSVVEGLAFAAGVLLARFNGVRGVRVVCGEGALPRPPDKECTPATTEAAVAPCGAAAAGPSLAAGPLAIIPFRATDAIPPATLGLGTTPTDAEREIGFAPTGGNPVPVLAALDIGVGTSAGAGLVGSSNSGGGKTGLEAARPVPEGPPPPILRRGTVPACCDALRACCTICCWRASTSRPLVT